MNQIDQEFKKLLRKEFLIGLRRGFVIAHCIILPFLILAVLCIKLFITFSHMP